VKRRKSRGSQKKQRPGKYVGEYPKKKKILKLEWVEHRAKKRVPETRGGGKGGEKSFQ